MEDFKEFNFVTESSDEAQLTEVFNFELKFCGKHLKIESGFIYLWKSLQAVHNADGVSLPFLVNLPINSKSHKL